MQYTVHNKDGKLVMHVLFSSSKKSEAQPYSPQHASALNVRLVTYTLSKQP